MEQNYLIGYDFGTSAVKAALFDRSGAVVATAREGYPLQLPLPGWAEQHPEDWWGAMALVTRRLLDAATLPPEAVAAIGLSAQMCGTIPVDEHGTALHEAIIWLDTRSAGIARRVAGGFPEVLGYNAFKVLRWLHLTNGAPNLSGKDPMTKMLWLRAQRPAIWAETHKLLDVKDYLVHRLTGRFVTSEDCAHLTWFMDTRPGHRRWSQTLLKAVGMDEALLPTIARATEAVGGLTAEAAAQLGLAPGATVVAGCGDVTAYALAAGDLAEGALHIHLGTSDWVAGHLGRRAVDIFTGAATVCAAEPERYLLIAAQESAGSCVDWAVRELGYGQPGTAGYAAFDAAAAESTAGARGLTFLPWLYGERVPVDDHRLRGGFLNLALTHNRADLARAVLEGIALNTRWALEPTEKITKTQGPLRLLGGGAVSALWCQIYADVLQRPVLQMADPALGGCRGAAMTAAVGAGWYPQLADTTAMAAVAQRFEPDTALAGLYGERYRLFTEHYRRNRPWYARMYRHTGGAA